MLKWREILHKENTTYFPIVDFIVELKRLDKAYPGEMPPLLIMYLLGRNDFYKAITRDAKKFTSI